MNQFIENKAIQNDNYLSQMTNSKNKSKLINYNWDLSGSLADTHKKFNETSEKIQLARNAENEMMALKQTINNNIHVADYLSDKKQFPNINTKSQIININNNEFKEKQILVNRLIYIINFILFSIGLGILLVLNVITFRFLGIMFFIGFLLLLYTLFTSGSFLRAYGETSTKIAKEITKDVIDIAAPQKTCPSECQPKRKIYANPNFDTINRKNKYNKICNNNNINYINYAKYKPYEYDKYETNENDYKDCEIGYGGT